jgi:hypothetical protein
MSNDENMQTLACGARGREFKSRRPDHLIISPVKRQAGMKKFFALLLLFGLTPMVLAQGLINFTNGGGGLGVFGFQGGAISLSISFSPLPGSAGTNQPSSSASYGSSFPPFPGQFPANAGNLFSISISLGTNRATDGWIYEKQDDGSFLPVMELTNETYSVPISWIHPINPVGPNNPFTNIYIIETWSPTTLTNILTLPIWATNVEPITNLVLPNWVAEYTNGFSQSSVTNYFYSQNWPLTTNQVQSLLAGKWCAVVSYGNDESAGKLIPTYIEPPSPAITISSLSVFGPGVLIPPGGNASSTLISSARNKPASVTLDGSNSSDPFNLPLQFLWQDGPDPIADAAATTLRLMPGHYEFQLEVSDGYSTNSATATVNVLSPEDAIGALSAATAQAGLNREMTHRLTTTLQKAQLLLERGDSFSGTRELATFRKDVNSFAIHMDSATAFYLDYGAENIIEAVGGEPGR